MREECTPGLNGVIESSLHLVGASQKFARVGNLLALGVPRILQKGDQGVRGRLVTDAIQVARRDSQVGFTGQFVFRIVLQELPHRGDAQRQILLVLGLGQVVGFRQAKCGLRQEVCFGIGGQIQQITPHVPGIDVLVVGQQRFAQAVSGFDDQRTCGEFFEECSIAAGSVG